MMSKILTEEIPLLKTVVYYLKVDSSKKKKKRKISNDSAGQVITHEWRPDGGMG